MVWRCISYWNSYSVLNISLLQPWSPIWINNDTSTSRSPRQMFRQIHLSPSILLFKMSLLSLMVRSGEIVKLFAQNETDMWVATISDKYYIDKHLPPKKQWGQQRSFKFAGHDTAWTIGIPVDLNQLPIAGVGDSWVPVPRHSLLQPVYVGIMPLFNSTVLLLKKPVQ